MKKIIGIDEVGRGCLAGPVGAAAYAFNQLKYPEQLRDSKKLSDKKRKKLIEPLYDSGQYGYGEVDAQEIDLHGILPSTFKAMRKALDELMRKTGWGWNEVDVVIDGNLLPPWSDIPSGVVRCVIKADDTIKEVSAASVLAKVKRDLWMENQAIIYPGYGFERHAGYGTAAHIKAISQLGATSLHRMTFAPLKNKVI